MTANKSYLCNAVQFSDQMSCSCGNVWDMNDPEPPACRYVSVAYDLSPADTEGAIRERLIAMGWTPPRKQVAMRGRDFEAWIESTGLPRKEIQDELGISSPTISRLVRYRGPIPYRYGVAIRYWERYGGDDPILTAEEIRTAWTAPVWKLAEFIGMHPEHLYRVLDGRHPIKKVTSMAIRQAIKDYYGQTNDDTPATTRD